ncbi:MAG: hypothetical protein RL757_737 [Bacteroidota bacterium]|jgi:hypothetical protein
MIKNENSNSFRLVIPNDDAVNNFSLLYKKNLKIYYRFSALKIF